MSMYGWAGCSALLVKAELHPPRTPTSPIPLRGCAHIEACLANAEPRPMEAVDIYTQEGRAYVKVADSWFDAAPLAFFQPDQVSVVAPCGRVTLVGYLRGEAIFLLATQTPGASWPGEDTP